MSIKPEDTVTTVDDWRKSVTQNYRSTEVSNIAQVLASLDASTSAASKMMLASRFEDTCFKNASSLAEYRKMIVKRLKNLQKNYVPTQQPPQVSTAEPSPPITDTIPTFKTSSESLQAAKQLQLLLQKSFGESLTCISKYGNAAVQKAMSSYGRDRAFQLQQHINNALQWAVDIATFPDDGTTLAITEILPNTTSDSAPIPIRSKVPWLLTFSSTDAIVNNAAFLYLQQIQKHLSQRIPKIKTHVLQYSNFNLFMEETLLGMEEKLVEKINRGENDVGQIIYQYASQDDTLKSIVEDMNKLEEIQKWMEKVTAIVPIPRNKAEEKEAGKVYLKKMEACCHLFLLIATLNLKDTGSDDPKLQNRSYLKRAHTIFIESIEALNKLCKDDQSVETTEHISLEDAWNKVMVYELKDENDSEPSKIIKDDEILEDMDDVHESLTHSKRHKRQRLHTTSLRSYPTIIQARVLAKPGRRIFPPFIHALKQKGAILERPEDGNGVSRIKMTFGKAFDLYIYFSPLWVAIRATKIDSTSTTPRSSSLFNLSTGLTNIPHVTQNLSSISSFKVMGVRGDYATVGHLVTKQLDFASARATHVLRQCFSEELTKMSKLSDNDVEILEGSAMIKFLQIARMTYLNQKDT